MEEGWTRGHRVHSTRHEGKAVAAENEAHAGRRRVRAVARERARVRRHRCTRCLVLRWGAGGWADGAPHARSHSGLEEPSVWTGQWRRLETETGRRARRDLRQGRRETRRHRDWLLPRRETGHRDVVRGTFARSPDPAVRWFIRGLGPARAAHRQSGEEMTWPAHQVIAQDFSAASAGLKTRSTDARPGARTRAKPYADPYVTGVALGLVLLSASVL